MCILYNRSIHIIEKPYTERISYLFLARPRPNLYPGALQAGIVRTFSVMGRTPKRWTRRILANKSLRWESFCFFKSTSYHKFRTLNLHWVISPHDRNFWSNLCAMIAIPSYAKPTSRQWKMIFRGPKLIKFGSLQSHLTETIWKWSCPTEVLQKSANPFPQRPGAARQRTDAARRRWNRSNWRHCRRCRSHKLPGSWAKWRRQSLAQRRILEPRTRISGLATGIARAGTPHRCCAWTSLR